MSLSRLGAGKLLVLGAAATVGLGEVAKFGVRKFKSDPDDERKISVIETPDKDLIVVEEGETSKSVDRARGEQDSIDNPDSSEDDGELS